MPLSRMQIDTTGERTDGRTKRTEIPEGRRIFRNRRRRRRSLSYHVGPGSFGVGRSRRQSKVEGRHDGHGVRTQVNRNRKGDSIYDVLTEGGEGKKWSKIAGKTGYILRTEWGEG